jgi:hypothetical protein
VYYRWNPRRHHSPRVVDQRLRGLAIPELAERHRLYLVDARRIHDAVMATIQAEANEVNANRRQRLATIVIGWWRGNRR